MIGGFGKIDGQSVMFIGQQKGKNTNFDNTEILVWQIQKDIKSTTFNENG